MDVYSNYLSRNASLVLAGVVALFADFQLIDFVPGFTWLWILLAAFLLFFTVDRLGAVYFWSVVMDRIIHLSIGGMFDHEDSMRGLNHAVFISTQDQLDRHWLTRVIKWRADLVAKLYAFREVPRATPPVKCCIECGEGLTQDALFCTRCGREVG